MFKLRLLLRVFKGYIRIGAVQGLVLFNGMNGVRQPYLVDVTDSLHKL
jgi:hypothetical protein